MITLALFPCSFTDGARVIGELSNALVKPVYTDTMVLRDIVAKTGRSQKRLAARLFFEGKMNTRTRKEKDSAISLVRKILAELIVAPTDWIYFGMFSSLLKFESVHTLHTLIVADEDCRVERAVTHEKISEISALRLIRNHDAKAEAWTQYLFKRQPYDSGLYDTVVHYDCQDLMDVVAWIYMKHEEHICRIEEKEYPAAGDNRELAAKIKLILLQKGIKANVMTTEGEVQITINASPHFFSRLAPDILELTSNLADVRSVKVIRHYQPDHQIGVCVIADKPRYEATSSAT